MSSDGTPLAAGLRCAQCGYPLDGLAADAVCPECGFLTPRVGTVPARVRCIGCGYALSGLSPAGVCPECGVGVRWSMPAPLLEFGDAAYVRRLRGGARWVCNTVLGLVLIWLAMMLSVFLLPLSMGPGLADVATRALGWLTHVLFFGHLWGWWLLATPDPVLGGDAPARGRSIREVVPLAAAVYALTLVWIIAAGPAALWGLTMLLQWLVVLVLSMLVAVFGMLIVRDLALRLPSPEIYRKAKFRVWFVPLMTFFGAAGVLICFLLPALLVALIMYYNIIAKLRHALTIIIHRMETDQGESGDGPGDDPGCTDEGAALT